MSRRTERLNSLMKEVIAEVIQRDVRNPGVNQFTSVTRVEIAPDLSEAKVHVSIIGDDESKQKTVESLNKAKGFIQVNASKKMTIRHFPALTFYLDESVEKQIRIETLVRKIHEEEDKRNK